MNEEVIFEQRKLIAREVYDEYVFDKYKKGLVPETRFLSVISNIYKSIFESSETKAEKWFIDSLESISLRAYQNTQPGLKPIDDILVGEGELKSYNAYSLTQLNIRNNTLDKLMFDLIITFLGYKRDTSNKIQYINEGLAGYVGKTVFEDATNHDPIFDEALFGLDKIWVDILYKEEMVSKIVNMYSLKHPFHSRLIREEMDLGYVGFQIAYSHEYGLSVLEESLGIINEMRAVLAEKFSNCIKSDDIRKELYTYIHEFKYRNLLDLEIDTEKRRKQA